MDYISIKLKQELFINAIISIHYFEYTPEFRYPGESHNFWEFIYCDKGQLCISAGDTEHILDRGQGYLHPPYQYHNVRADGGRSANSVVISFESDTKELYDISDKILSTDSYTASCLFSVLREARDSFENEQGKIYDKMLIRKNGLHRFGAEQMIQNYTELMLIDLIRSCDSARSTQDVPQAEPLHESKRDRILVQALEFMRENIGNKIVFSDIAAAVSVSSTTLKNMFTRAYNHGAMEHLTRMRLDLAKELLRDGALSCTDIASVCGFCSIHHFSYAFKKYESMSPTEYARSIKALLNEKP